MSKVLKTAAVIVGAVALIAAGIATANPGLVIAGAKIGTIATVLSVAAGVLSLAATLTAKKPKGTDYQATGSPEQFTLDPDGPLPCIFGRFATAGRAIYRRTWDTADAGVNDRRSWVIILSLGACYSLDDLVSRYARHASQAKAWGLDLVAYEGGLSWYYFMAPDKGPYDKLLGAITTDARGGTITTKMVTTFGAAGGKLLMQFADIGTNSQWGPWGMQPDLYTLTPRSKALMDASGR